MKNKIILYLLFLAFVGVGCKDLITPQIENNRQLEDSYNPSDAKFPYGLILNGYNRIPVNSWSFNDVATDDAVTNDKTSSLLKMATGQWAANNNPVEQWSNCYAAIQYMNLTLEQIDKVTWAEDSTVSRLFNMRVKGEAYGLRALFYFYLLQAHAGFGADGELLGVPLVLNSQVVGDDFNLPRASFQDCMTQIYADLNLAESYLPIDYLDLTDNAQVPAKYGSITKEQFNRAMGKSMSGLFSGRVAMALEAKLALLAASPAFSQGSGATWAKAADAAARIIDLKGGVSGIASNGLTWYTNTSEIAGLADGQNPDEILWRTNYSESNNLESDNFPPTLNGKGRINPTQNLVDAFPMANGYPINQSGSGYDDQNPYANRDSRLTDFILVDGTKAGVNSSAINTEADGTTNDGLNKTETSTRTGYYLKKLLRQDVNLSSTSTTTQRHYKPLIRYTEIYLIYAEAANEAWGPEGTGGHTYSAYDIIKALRNRAGVGTNNGDPYLESSSADKDKMRDLIRNERRLELCFEGFRFWDLRRWNAALNETAKGIRISDKKYTAINVENRVYKDYMNYGPIPYSEVLKFTNLVQNKGW
ncbi:Starch-binding associating with outer membrane [Arachidicoccus rhizosphaerae]|uniref:Starch-binding associating with outer membrane n=1 Tax=Arachidicoccus rhizosphaerae TaxID=551991 RepID=A0A1H3XP61_9BACT|nr:RagB/SusD family nutrient uptake outer membrane protein [Arachidicoccus rhizosphaerae]SEA01040.1 Starch-binding associating with outer membrane [Arachidicoccus rhizosphaerae]